MTPPRGKPVEYSLILILGVVLGTILVLGGIKLVAFVMSFM